LGFSGEHAVPTAASLSLEHTSCMASRSGEIGNEKEGCDDDHSVERPRAEHRQIGVPECGTKLSVEPLQTSSRGTLEQWAVPLREGLDGARQERVRNSSMTSMVMRSVCKTTETVR
jgi:hypothetical protein